VIVKFLVSAWLPSKKDGHHLRAFGTESKLSIPVPIGEARLNTHVVDPTLIHAPSSTKTREQERDPEMQ